MLDRHGEVCRLLQFQDEYSSADGVRDAGWYQDSVPAAHREHVHRPQHLFDTLGGHPAGELFFSHLAVEAEEDLSSRLGEHDPRFGLAVRAAEVALGKVAVGVRVDDQPFGGVEQFDEETGVHSGCLDVVRAEERYRVSGHCVRQQSSILEPGKPGGRVSETPRDRADPVLGRGSRSRIDATEAGDGAATRIEVRDEVRREETRSRGQIHRGWQRGALEPLWEDVLDSSCPWLANPRKGEVTGPVVTLEHSHRTDQGYLVAVEPPAGGSGQYQQRVVFTAVPRGWAFPPSKVWAARTRRRSLGLAVPDKYESDFLCADGSELPVQLAIGSVQLRDGRANIAFISDITERREAERGAEERSHFLEEFLEAIPVPVFCLDGSLHYVGCNKAYAAFLGHSKDEVIGRTVFDVTSAHLAKRFDASDRDLLAHPEQPVEHEFERLGPDGTPRYVLTHKAVFSDIAGKPAGIVGVNLDVTEIRRAEQDLAASAVQLTLTLEGAVEALGATTELRDPYTASHQRRVAELACAIARELGWNEARLESLRIAAVLHDIGKIVLPAEILAKPGRLSEIEMQLIRQHAGAVADVVEAMISHRPYRPALPIEVAMAELEDGAGTRYDAAACETAIFLIREQGFTFSK